MYKTEKSIPVCTLSPTWSSDMVTDLPFSRETLAVDGKQGFRHLLVVVLGFLVVVVLLLVVVLVVVVLGRGVGLGIGSASQWQQ